MNPESDIKTLLTRVDCRGQVVQLKEQITLSEEELTTLRRFFPVIDQLIYFQRFKFFQSQQTRSLSSQASLSNQTSARSSNGPQQQ